jgi:hypothetical protein
MNTVTQPETVALSAVAAVAVLSTAAIAGESVTCRNWLHELHLIPCRGCAFSRTFVKRRHGLSQTCRVHRPRGFAAET